MIAFVVQLATAALMLVAAPPPPPVPVIFDTDMGNDIDDALALAMLHALESRGECSLVGVTLTNRVDSAGAFIRVVNRFYGRQQIPVGMTSATHKGSGGRRYLDATLASAPEGWRDNSRVEEAVPVLRRLLRESREPVVVVQVGFSDNLAALMENDAELIRQKVRLLSIMAGDFVSGKPEYNVRINVPAAKRVIEGWPAPVVLSGWEIGAKLLYPAANIERDFRYAEWHPIVEAYKSYAKMPYNRPTWDLTAVLEAVRPGYFDLSPPGVVEVDDAGRTRFRPEATGTRRHLILRDPSRALEALVSLVSQPPQKR